MWNFCGQTFSSRLLLRADVYPSLEVLEEVIAHCGVELIVLPPEENDPRHSRYVHWLPPLKEIGVTVLPSLTCGAMPEVAARAHALYSVYQTTVIGLMEPAMPPGTERSFIADAASELMKQGFLVIPMIPANSTFVAPLVSAGCSSIILRHTLDRAPADPEFRTLSAYRNQWPELTIVFDGDLSRPSQVAAMMEAGVDAVTIHGAIIRARDVISMAEAFADGVLAGRMAYEAERD